MSAAKAPTLPASDPRSPAHMKWRKHKYKLAREKRKRALRRPDDPIDKRLVHEDAVHEAAHAIVGHVLGRRVRTICLYGGGGGGEVGFAEHRGRRGVPFCEQAATALAGYLADRQFKVKPLKVARHGAANDLENTREWLGTFYREEVRILWMLDAARLAREILREHCLAIIDLAHLITRQGLVLPEDLAVVLRRHRVQFVRRPWLTEAQERRFGLEP